MSPTARLLSRDGAWAGLLYAVAIGAYLAPALLTGDVLSPTSALYPYVPWAAAPPADLPAYTNSLLIDAPQQFVPWLRDAREALHAGDVPWWNHDVLAGAPFFSNAQVGLLSPFNLPFWIVPFDYAFGLSAALKLWVAAYGTYALARALGLHFWPALVGGLLFAFCAFQIVWLSHPLVTVSVLLPWMLLFTERVVTRTGTRDALWLTLVSAVAFAGAHPGTQAHLCLAVAVYALVRGGGMVPRASWLGALRRVALAGAAVVAGAALLAFLLLPSALLVPGSTGELVRTAGGFDIPVTALRSLVFPDWWGRPSDLVVPGEPLNFNERTLYIGAAGLLLAAAGVLGRNGWRERLPLVALCAIGLVVPFGVPPFDAAVEALPVLGNVRNARLILLFQLGACVLAAFGLQALLDRRLSRRTLWALFAGAGLLGLVALAAREPSLQDLRNASSQILSGRPFPNIPAVLVLASIGWWLILAAGAGLALLADSHRARRWTIAAALALAAFEVVNFGAGSGALLRDEQWWITIAVALGLSALALRSARRWAVAAAIVVLATAIDVARHGYAYDSIVMSPQAAVLFVGALAALRFMPARLRPAPVVLALLAVVALDVARFTAGYQPMGPPSRVFPPPTPGLRALADTGYERAAAVEATLPPDSGMFHDVRDARGYDPPEPDLRFLHLWHRMADPAAGDMLVLPAFNDTTRRLLEMLSVRRLMAPPGSAQPGLAALSREYEGADAVVYRLDEAAKRAFVPERLVPVEGEAAALDALAAPDFRPARDAVIEDAAAAGAGSVSVAREGRSSVELRANMTAPGLVVLTDRLTDGWRVFVDDREADVVRVNSVLRGVSVPAGAHEVEWRYRPPGLRVGLAISLATLLALMAAVVVARRRRATAPPPPAAPRG